MNAVRRLSPKGLGRETPGAEGSRTAGRGLWSAPSSNLRYAPGEANPSLNLPERVGWEARMGGSSSEWARA